MKNPWEKVSLSDYESHMSLDSIMQLQTLNVMMKRQFRIAQFESIMILGIAGGNGLEHITPDICRKVYGVDINKDYLKACSERYPELKNILECICADLTDPDINLPSAELVTADLLIEYIGYKNFTRIIRRVRPDCISCIIQVNTGTEFVSDSPYIHAFDGIENVHHSIDEHGLSSVLAAENYTILSRYEEKTPNGKKLVQLDFKAL